MLDFVFESTTNCHRSGSFTKTQISGESKAVKEITLEIHPEASNRNRYIDTSYAGDISHLIASRLEVMLKVS